MADSKGTKDGRQAPSSTASDAQEDPVAHIYKVTALSDISLDILSNVVDAKCGMTVGECGIMYMDYDDVQTWILTIGRRSGLHIMSIPVLRVVVLQ